MSKDSVENYKTAKQLIGGLFVVMILLGGDSYFQQKRIDTLEECVLQLSKRSLAIVVRQAEIAKTQEGIAYLLMGLPVPLDTLPYQSPALPDSMEVF